MKHKLIGYLKDIDDHWVAKLACGHVQHVRHAPPWTTREWVTTEAGRQSFVGSEFDCAVCSEMVTALSNSLASIVKKALNDGYESSGISGLCDEGRWEAAVGVIRPDEFAKWIRVGMDDLYRDEPSAVT